MSESDNETSGVHADAAARKARCMPDIIAGMGAREIAAKHGFGESTVRRWMAEVKGEIIEASGDMIAEASKRLVEGAGKALDKLEQLIDDPDPKVALGAANSWLDRAGVVKTERREHTGANGGPVQFAVVLSEADADELASEADE